jgi:hypothetical protein
MITTRFAIEVAVMAADTEEATVLTRLAAVVSVIATETAAIIRAINAADADTDAAPLTAAVKARTLCTAALTVEATDTAATAS